MSEVMVEVPAELIADIKYHLTCYNTTKSRTNAGYHLTELFNKVHDLATWHPGYEYETGTLPYEREDFE